MGRVIFRGQAATSVWRNIADRLDQLEPARTIHELKWEERRVAEIKLVDLMLGAAFGYPRKFVRLLELSDLNADIFRVSLRTRPLTVVLELDTGAKVLEFGHVQGFTAVMPLTLSGYDDYMQNDKSPTEFTRAHIEGFPYQPETIQRVMITGVVHFPSIRRMYSQSDDTAEWPTSGYDVVYDLFVHVGRFVPPFKVVGGSRVRQLVVEPPFMLPTILCPISGQWMGENRVVNAGFDLPGLDKDRFRKYVLDLADIFKSSVAAKRRRAMLQTAWMLYRVRRRPSE